MKEIALQFLDKGIGSWWGKAVHNSLQVAEPYIITSEPMPDMPVFRVEKENATAKPT